MHIIEFDHRFIPKPYRGIQVMAYQVTSKAMPALYGYRRAFVQLTWQSAWQSIFQSALVLALLTSITPSLSRAAEPLKIVALGDSLTAGYKLPADAALPVVLEKALRKDGFDVALVNAGVSGDTAADGLARFDWTFIDGADGAIVELGANDMLRGLDTKRIYQTLDEILSRLKQRKIPAVLVGVRAMPNLGPDYAVAFDQMYKDLAHKYDVPLFPFILEGVMNNPPLQLADHLHPNREGVEKIVENMLPMVESFAKSLPPKT